MVIGITGMEMVRVRSGGGSFFFASFLSFFFVDIMSSLLLVLVLSLSFYLYPFPYSSSPSCQNKLSLFLSMSLFSLVSGPSFSLYFSVIL